MFINKVTQFSVAIVASLLLGGCGGGGGGGGGSSSPTPSATTFPVAQANAQMIINGYHATLSITGKISGINISGTGTLTVSPAVAATYMGRAVMSNSNTITATVSGNGQTVAVSVNALDYVDSNYNELAALDMSEGTLTEIDQIVALPATVHVGDSGNLGSATVYSDATKTTVTGTATVTYSVVADTGTSIILS